MSETMIERLAFATCECSPCICKNRAGFEGMSCLNRARAGLAAIREPTEEMCEAPFAELDSLVDAGYHVGTTRRIFEMMIDAALNESPKP